MGGVRAGQGIKQRQGQNNGFQQAGLRPNAAQALQNEHAAANDKAQAVGLVLGCQATAAVQNA